ncbi:uncharacterized protein N7496_001851 [Penicillium cataractarum]|uniref:Uncharacterized protein n=1 Tax=Penicillium cataractarum TaxID=2100454 RepID=A0A9X0B7B1_9EURO|nr:uncharacterized protein N7496_001851 [Penicillium cataractarum]KAJ5390783.1 hypothetical protein N7496_001851 [Penicillium cataractarum]
MLIPGIAYRRLPQSATSQNETHSSFEDVAYATTASLDISDLYIKQLARHHKEEVETTKKINGYISQLADLRHLVQQIRYQNDLQTPTVGTALRKVQGATKQTERGLKADECTPASLVNPMDELTQATANLISQLPGDISVANENKATEKFQNNAPIGGNAPTWRVNTTASRNEAVGAFQNNAPIYGDSAWLASYFKDS